MHNIDKDFESYMKKWYAKNSGSANIDELMASMSDVYDQWADTPSKNFGGISPRNYIMGLSDEELLKEFCSFNGKETDPPFILCDELARREAVDKKLFDLMQQSDSSPSFIILCGNLLSEKESLLALPLFIEWIFDEGREDALRDYAAEMLAAMNEHCADEIIKRLDKCKDLRARQYAADVLYSVKRDEVYRLLADLFLVTGEIGLYCQYFAAQGDERAIPLLKKFAEDCDYLDYLEIRYAVETLGGDLEERTFSQ